MIIKEDKSVRIVNVKTGFLMMEVLQNVKHVITLVLPAKITKKTV